jgi:large subunit ribosomal protein L19
MKANRLTKETIKYLNITEKNFPVFKVGDTILVSVKVIEGEKERIQDFEGVVMGMKGDGIQKTFRVRKLAAGGIPVERIFPYYSPIVNGIRLISKGVVRRAKLYYLRKKKGRDAIVEKEVISSNSNAKKA